MTNEQIYGMKQDLVHDILRTRHGMNMTQKDVESICGVKQPVIARMERGLTDPQLTTILKVLAALGKTLAIVPLPQERDE